MIHVLARWVLCNFNYLSTLHLAQRINYQNSIIQTFSWSQLHGLDDWGCAIYTALLIIQVNFCVPILASLPPSTFIVSNQSYSIHHEWCNVDDCYHWNYFGRQNSLQRGVNIHTVWEGKISHWSIVYRSNLRWHCFSRGMILLSMTKPRQLLTQCA